MISRRGGSTAVTFDAFVMFEVFVGCGVVDGMGDVGCICVCERRALSLFPSLSVYTQHMCMCGCIHTLLDTCLCVATCM